MNQVLEDARRHGRRQLLALRVPTVTISTLMILFGIPVNLFSDYGVLSFAAYDLVALGAFGLILSLVPSDKRGIPIANLAVFVPALFVLSLLNIPLGLMQLQKATSPDCDGIDESGYAVSCQDSAMRK